MRYRRTIEDAWRRIRALRHRPPNHAEKTQRKLLFAAAAKQSEGFFRASDAAGYEIKPILLYYGLSQAARAIIAAMDDPRDRNSEPSSHGITCPNLGQNPLLGDVNVATSGASGSFSALARTLGSPTLSRPATLRELWMCLPEGVEVPLQGSRDAWGAATLKRADGRRLLSELNRFPRTHEKIAEIGRLPYQLATMNARDVEHELDKRYPQIKHFAPAPGEFRELSWGWQPLPDRLNVGLTYRQDHDTGLAITGLDILRCGEISYGDIDEVSTWIVPVIAENDSPMHPLAVWWSVLFPLSMLARYYPSSWIRTLDIDSSEDAPAIEYLLDEAHQACINLIVEIFEFDQFRKHKIPKEIQIVLDQERKSEPGP